MQTRLTAYHTFVTAHRPGLKVTHGVRSVGHPLHAPSVRGMCDREYHRLGRLSRDEVWAQKHASVLRHRRYL